MELLKNYYSEEYIDKIANIIHSIYLKFDKKLFVKRVFNDDWSNKELKARMRHITEVLHGLLPGDYKRAIGILKKAAPKMNGISKHAGFLNMFCPDFVEIHGMDDWGLSMDALEEFTKYSSSEFAIRTFIVKDEVRAMAQMLKWSKSDNYHVRRLASEGCRSRLPWAMALPKFKKDPSLIVPILEILKDDESEYVRRSVANNLNDITKDNPQIVIDIAKRWLGFSKNRDKLVKHACRTLLKAGNQEVLKIFGYGGQVEMERFVIARSLVTQQSSSSSVIARSLVTQQSSSSSVIARSEATWQSIKIGENLNFNFLANIKKPAKIRFEYAIYYKKANGSHSKKVFQLKEGDFKAGEIQFSKKHSLRQMSTRKHYVGEHFLAIIVNGIEVGKVSFEVAKR